MSDLDLFKRLSLDETLRRTYKIYADGFGVFTKISLLASAVLSLSWALSLVFLLSSFGVEGEKFDDPNYLLDHLGAYYGLLGINQVIAVFVYAVANIAMIRAVTDLYLKQPPSLEACVKVGLRRWCTILGACVLGYLGVMIGMMLLVIPGVYLSAAWFVVTPIIVIEGLGVFASFRRSMELVSGSWCYVYCTLTIVMLLTVGVSIVWTTLAPFTAKPGTLLFSSVGFATSQIPRVVLLPVHAIAMTIMYINLRVEKEALTADILAKELGESCGEAASYDPLLSEEEVVPDDP